MDAQGGDMDDPVENRNLPLFCLLDILFTRGHHGLPDFPPGLLAGLSFGVGLDTVHVSIVSGS